MGPRIEEHSHSLYARMLSHQFIDDLGMLLSVTRLETNGKEHPSRCTDKKSEMLTRSIYKT